jgi:hypothetical protein
VSVRTEPSADWRPVIARWVAAVLAGVGLLWVLAALAYYEIFGMFAAYDDEGYMMLTVKHFLAGHPLYEEVRTLYGPAYYFYKWLIHEVVGLPLSHDVVRLTTLAFRLLTGVTAAAAAFGLSRSVSLAAATQILVTHHLALSQNEPGHPQELCALVTMLLVAIPCVAASRRRAWMPVVLGILIAVLTMTKVNLGAFAGLAVWMAFLSLMRLTPASAVLRIVSAATLVALLWALMWSLLAAPETQRFAMTETLAVVAVSTIALTRGRAGASLGDLAALVGAAAVGAALMVVALVAWGTYPAAVLDNLVLMPARMPALFVANQAYIFPPSIVATLSALASAALAVWVRTTEGSRLTTHVVGLGKLAFGVAALTASLRLDFPMLFTWLTPFLWLVLIAPAGVQEDDGRQLARLVLGWLATLAPLQAFPVAGSQMAIGTLLYVVVGAVCVADAIGWLGSLSGRGVRRALNVAAAAIALLLAGNAMWKLHLARLRYAGLVAVDLPGTARLRLPTNHVSLLRTLTDALRERADTFLCDTGFNSLYFWTGKEPPTLDVIGNQIRFSSDERQAAMMAALLAHQRPMVVRFTGSMQRYPPFEARLQQLFTPLTKIGDYELLVPR